MPAKSYDEAFFTDDDRAQEDAPGSEVCPYCGKEYEDFSDYGCEFCDSR